LVNQQTGLYLNVKRRAIGAQSATPPVWRGGAEIRYNGANAPLSSERGKPMRLRLLFSLTVLCGGLFFTSQAPARAADWNPPAFTKEDTVQIRTVGPEEGEYWFPVWLVVIDGQVYVRLGTRAAERVTKNKTSPSLAIKIAGQQFDHVKGEAASDMAKAVADAMAGKYWSDIFVRFMSHPLTLRLIPEEKK
jgi:hypothetical protein